MTDYNELVRCGECKFWSETEKGLGRCLKSGFKTPKDFLGEDGERKDQGMTDYKKLVEALRHCKIHLPCKECPRYGSTGNLCISDLHDDAAAAIEALRKRLVSALTALHLANEKMGYYGIQPYTEADGDDMISDWVKTLVHEELEQQLPNRGEWIRVEGGESYHYECSKCGERPLYSRYGDVVLSGVCPMCGAKMKVHE